MYPKDYRYSKEHEWLQVDGDTATLGITDFAQQELGEVVFVEMPDVGETFDAGEEIGSIESVKAVSDIYAPVACEIVGVNGALDDAPETVNEDPHGDGWLVKIKISDASELDGLLDAAAYQSHIEGDG